MRNKELELNFKNWDFDSVIVELAKYIEKGWHVVTWSSSHSLRGESELEVTLVDCSYLHNKL